MINPISFCSCRCLLTFVTAQFVGGCYGMQQYRSIFEHYDQVRSVYDCDSPEQIVAPIIDMHNKSLSQSTQIDVDYLKHLIWENGFVVVKNGQLMNDDDLVDFVALFGPPIANQPRHKQKHWNEYIGIITNVFANGTLDYNDTFAWDWHTDGTFYDKIDLLTFLYGKNVSINASFTQIADMRMAYHYIQCQNLSLLDYLSDKTVVAQDFYAQYDTSYNDAPWKQQCYQHSILHQQADTAPEKHGHEKRYSIYYYSASTYYTSVPGLTEYQASKLLSTIENMIYNSSISKYIQYSHAWSKNDLLIWDNGATMHRNALNNPNAVRHLLRAQSWIVH